MSQINHTQEINPILAELLRAKEMGFTWASEAIDAYDDDYANLKLESFNSYKISSPISAALICSFDWKVNGGEEKWSQIYMDLLQKKI